MSRDALLFLNDREARMIDALCARIVPGDDADPGALQADATCYIDRTLAGHHRDLQPLYRAGLGALEERSRSRFGAGFLQLDAGRRDALLAELDARAGGDEEDVPARFFAHLCEHVLQGLLCDPAYGGNRDKVGWRLIGYPGAQWGYSEEQMRPDFDATTIEPIGIDELRRLHAAGD
ncbi:MAG: gluconate 2-dehydrogenase subunit 3 family protein [Chloroflexi bacterium]|nr:MAG: gluconate 2-dehydrogenase subunit 3 family protein [Chloroflexota bacterium]